MRKGLDLVFTQRELKWLDDILPATQVKKEEIEIEKTEEPVLIKVTVSYRKTSNRLTKLYTSQ